MADNMDRATDITAAHTETSITRVRAQLAADGTPDCETCGEPIPARRRQIHPAARRCLPCQEAMEKPRVR